MEIVQVAEARSFVLRDSFISPYRKQGDPFRSLLARSTYNTKYCRDSETWTDTIRRVVEGSCSLSHMPVSEREAEMLFHLFWTGQALPPGRGLWTGGVPGIPADARYNCWFVTLGSIDDWCWTANQLMLGGGVGVGLQEIDQLPKVVSGNARFAIWCNADHQDVGEVSPNDKSFLNGTTPIFTVVDSREGWVAALRQTLEAAFENRDLIADVSPIRHRGLPIKTFGGVACGPGPLAHLLRSVWTIIRAAAGRRLTSVECLDITNFIGFCVKSGNVRRSALIVLGHAMDQAFRDAKKDMAAIHSHRHTSNNSIVLRSWQEIADLDYEALVEDMMVAGTGEPGILNLPLGWETDPGAKGVNPCLSGDTRVATQFGLIRIVELARRSGQALRVTTDVRVLENYNVDLLHASSSEGTPNARGVEIRDALPAFKTSDAQPVFRLTTAHGYSCKATGYHKFPTPDGFVELQHLHPGDILLLQSDEGQWGDAGSEEIGTIIGCVEGDGNFSGEDAVTLRFWGDQKHIAAELLPACQRLAATIPSQNGRKYGLSVVDVPARDSCEINSHRLRKALAEVGYREKGRIPEVIWRGTRGCVRGYLRGLFATDGHIAWSTVKQCFSIRLSQSNVDLLREVQVLLLNFGIVSSVYLRRNEQWRSMPDGAAGMKEYWCEDQYDLVISKENARTFAERVGFLLPGHEEAYLAWKASWVRGPYRERFTDVVTKIEFVAVEPVYCTTQPTHHTFIAEGIVTGNCGEQLLHDREACNLAEFFPAQFLPGTEPETVVRLVARYCLRQRLSPLSDPKSQEIGQRNMRIGVGLGGLCDFDWTPSLLTEWYAACRQEANDYADELGVNRPITVTTVKPSGTISLLNGSSPGLHAPFAPHYIRRARLAVNDPMVPALIEAGVEFELCQYDNTGNTLVFSFPTKAVHTRSTVQTETIFDQFRRQRVVQEYWADNAVSATLSFDPATEKDETVALLREYVPHLKSTTCLPKVHGYAQAPYEAVDEQVYNRMASAIRHDHPLVRGGDLAIDECRNGVCPVR